jgi:outer membrane immunogenic protein
VERQDLIPLYGPGQAKRQLLGSGCCYPGYDHQRVPRQHHSRRPELQVLGGPAGGTPDHPAPVYNAPARQPTPYEWTGFYAGINGGYGIARDLLNQVLGGAAPIVPNTDARILPQGRLVGGQFGYNFQTGHIVYGVEGDIQWANQNDPACGLICVNAAGTGATFDAEQTLTWFGTARGRLGYAGNGWLLYVTGGGAWGGVVETQTAAASLGGITIGFSNTSRYTKSGWVVGGGAEVPIIGPWSAKIEYLYMDLGTITDNFPMVTLTGTSSIRDNIFRAGLNYKLGWGGPY